MIDPFAKVKSDRHRLYEVEQELRESKTEIKRLRDEIDILRTRLRGLEIDYSAEQVECAKYRRLLREAVDYPNVELPDDWYVRAEKAGGDDGVV